MWLSAGVQYLHCLNHKYWRFQLGDPFVEYEGSPGGCLDINMISDLDRNSHYNDYRQSHGHLKW